MKSAEKFYREALADGRAAFDALCASLPQSVNVSQLADVDMALSVFGDAIDILADHAKQAKARAERIQWIETTLGPYVARVGRRTAEYSPATRRVVVYGADLNVLARLDATSTESASRKIRAWRKKQ